MYYVVFTQIYVPILYIIAIYYMNFYDVPSKSYVFSIQAFNMQDN